MGDDVAGAGGDAAQLAATINVHALIVGWKELVSERKRLAAEAAVGSVKIIVIDPVYYPVYSVTYLFGEKGRQGTYGFCVSLIAEFGPLYEEIKKPVCG